MELGVSIALAVIGLAVVLGVVLVFGAGFRSGTRGQPEGRWQRSGEPMSGNVSPPVLLIGGLLGFAATLFVAAVVVGVT